jgi:hypothetical protein
MNLFCVSESNCSIGRILLVVRIGHRAIVVAAGEHGDFTTELAQDDLSHSPPRWCAWRESPRLVIGSVDSIGVCFCREIAPDRVGSGDGFSECLDQFLDQLVRDVTP